MRLQIEPDKAVLESFFKENHIIWMAFFGSVITERFAPTCDVDVMVNFEPAYVPGLLTVPRIKKRLSAILGRKADLRTTDDSSDQFRLQVLRQAVVLYAA